jgi:hypothetical protein
MLITNICKQSIKDPNCQSYDSNNNCIKCIAKFYLSITGMCQGVSPLCKEYNNVTGACTSCWTGYVLSINACIVANSQNYDVRCSKRVGNTCVSCYSGYYLNSNTLKCTPQNLLCKTVNLVNGDCLGCYDGYTLQNGACTTSNSTTTDINCQQFEQNNSKICLKCYNGYFISSSSAICT